MAKTRDWVLENVASDERHRPLWHWFGMGRAAVAACGKFPIPGSPLLAEEKPENEELEYSTVCPICNSKWKSRQRELKEGT